MKLRKEDNPRKGNEALGVGVRITKQQRSDAIGDAKLTEKYYKAILDALALQKISFKTMKISTESPLQGAANVSFNIGRMKTFFEMFEVDYGMIVFTAFTASGYPVETQEIGEEDGYPVNILEQVGTVEEGHCCATTKVVRKYCENAADAQDLDLSMTCFEAC
jgi:hypothetical protein